MYYPFIFYRSGLRTVLCNALPHTLVSLHELTLAIKGDARNFIERQLFKDTRLYIAIDSTINSIFIAYCIS